MRSKKGVKKTRTTRSDRENHKDSFNQLKSENSKLKKELARTRKELKKQIDQEHTENEELIEFSVVEEKKHHKCPKCGENSIKDLEIGIYKFIVCSECGFKKRGRKNG